MKCFEDQLWVSLHFLIVGNLSCVVREREVVKCSHRRYSSKLGNLPRQLGLSSQVPLMTGEPPVAAFLTHYTCYPAVCTNAHIQAADTP